MQKANQRRVGQIGAMPVTLGNVQDLSILLYLCGLFAHRLGSPVDILIRYGSFALCGGIGIWYAVDTGRFKYTRYNVWMLAFIGYVAVSCSWAHNFFHSVRYVPDFAASVCLTFCILNRISSQEDIDRYLKIIAAAILYMCAILALKSPRAHWGTADIGSALGLLKNAVGLPASVGFVITFYLIDKCRKRARRKYYLAALAVFAAVALYSGTRKAFGIIPAGVVIYLLYRRRYHLTGKTMLWWAVAIIALVAVTAFGYQLVMTNEKLYRIIGRRLVRVYEAYFLGGKGGVSIDERRFYIMKAKELFRDHWLFGYGSNAFMTYMSEINYSHVAYCHNNFWELLCTLGVVGFTLYYSMPFSILWRLTFKLPRQRGDRRQMAMLWALCGTIFVFGWWLVYYYAELYYILFGLAYMASHLGEAAGARQSGAVVKR